MRGCFECFLFRGCVCVWIRFAYVRRQSSLSHRKKTQNTCVDMHRIGGYNWIWLLHFHIRLVFFSSPLIFSLYPSFTQLRSGYGYLCCFVTAFLISLLFMSISFIQLPLLRSRIFGSSFERMQWIWRTLARSAYKLLRKSSNGSSFYRVAQTTRSNREILALSSFDSDYSMNREAGCKKKYS